MNRRNLLKTLLGTSCAITIPWAIPREPWEKLKSQSARLIEKWKPILAYVSNDVKPLNGSKWEDMACLMEYTEQKYMKYMNNGSRVLFSLIPAMRRFEGDIDLVEGKYFDRKCIEFKLYMQREDTGYWLYQRRRDDYFWVELKNDYKTIRYYLT